MRKSICLLCAHMYLHTWGGIHHGISDSGIWDGCSCLPAYCGHWWLTISGHLGAIVTCTFTPISRSGLPQSISFPSLFVHRSNIHSHEIMLPEFNLIHFLHITAPKERLILKSDQDLISSMYCLQLNWMHLFIFFPPPRSVFANHTRSLSCHQHRYCPQTVLWSN